MENGNLASHEKQAWPDDETEMARLCGLRYKCYPHLFEIHSMKMSVIEKR